MPDDAPFDPCRAWLGIDAADLVAAHLVLGIAATETDPLVIVRAADRRLTDLRAVDPGVFAGARDAIAKRIEECRDAMLAGAVTARSLGAPAAAAPPAPPPAAPPPAASPPVSPLVAPPPPSVGSGPETSRPAAAQPDSAVLPTLRAPPPPSTRAPIGGTAWPAAPAATAPVPLAPPAPPVPDRAGAVPATGLEAGPAPVGFAGPAIAVRRPMPRRSESGSGGAVAATIALLALTAVALALSVLWPQLTGSARRGREVATVKPVRHPPQTQPPQRKPEPPQTPQPRPAPKPGVTPAPRPSPPPVPEPPRSPDSTPSPSPLDESLGTAEPPGPRQRPERVPEQQPEPQPEPPMVDQAEVRARVSQEIGAAWKALRRGEFDTVNRALDAAADAAGDDQQSADRVAAWQQLATYAREYPGYRDQALAAAGAGRDYVVAGRPVAVVEVRPDEIIYRDGGRNVTVPRDAIPLPLEAAIVSTWFAADGRPANHLFLGAAHLARAEPDVAGARHEWEQAARGGESDGRLLLTLLDDPAIRGD